MGRRSQVKILGLGVITISGNKCTNIRKYLESIHGSNSLKVNSIVCIPSHFPSSFLIYNGKLFNTTENNKHYLQTLNKPEYNVISIFANNKLFLF